MTDREPLESGETLWRRIHKSHLLASGKVSSMAFSDFELSVDVARIQKDKSITLQDGVGVAEFMAGDAQILDQETVADPLEENLSHALVIGKKTKAVKRKLRNSSTFTMREDLP